MITPSSTAPPASAALALAPAACGRRMARLDAEIGKATLTAPLRLSWADGTQWALEVPRVETKKARSLLDQLETVS